jgi:O-antigen/teichoic acid export membrane protein
MGAVESKPPASGPAPSPPDGTSLGAVARGVSWVGAGHAVSQLAWFGSLFIVAALVDPHAFGSVAAAMVVVQAAWLVVNSGTRGAIVISERLTRAQVRRALVLNVATGAAIAAAAIALAHPLLTTVFPGADPLVLQVLAVTIALNGLSIVPLSLLRRNLAFRRHALVNAGAAIISSGVAAGAALAGAGVWALVARQVVFQLLMAVFAWMAVRRYLPVLAADRGHARRDPVAKWFFGLTTISFLTLNVDNIVVGHFTSVAELGLYSLAFTIAFSPVTQFAWQVTKVIQPTAARSRRGAVLAERSETAVRLTALLLLPFVPVAVVLAPVLLPALLSPRWASIVTPFQVLIAVGVVHAVLAIVREILAATGRVRFCVVADATCLLATVGTLLVLVPRAGIVGAALAHVAVAGALLASYAVAGARRLGSSGRRMWRAVRGVVGPVLGQAAVTMLWLRTLEQVGVAAGTAAVTAGLVGAIALVVLLWAAPSEPLRDGAAVLAALLGRGRRTAPAAQPEPEPEPRPQPQPEARPQPEPEARPQPEPEARPEPQPEARPQPRLAPLPRRGLRAPSVPGVHVLAAVLVAVGALGGIAATLQPRFVLGGVAATLALVFAFRAPVAHLLLLVAVSALLPLQVQAQFGSGGEVSSAGVLPSDVLLVAALVRAAVVLPRSRLPRRAWIVAALMILFLAAVFAQLVHARALGRPLSGAGGEFRVLLAFGTLLAAMPLCADPASRRRLLAGLPIIGLALGVWGIAQFALHLRYDMPEVNVSVASFNTAGRVVGLLGFPVAAVLALAVLTGPAPLRSRTRALLVATCATNCAAAILSFERTIMLATLMGFALVFLRGTARQRVRIATVVPLAVGAVLLALAVTQPAFLPAYRERVASLASLRTDPSVLYRLAESQLISAQIRAHPVEGSGLAATILIGRPGTNVPVVPRSFAENGYEWLAWKIGIPAAALLWALLALAILAPGRRAEATTDAVFRRACQAIIAALAVATLTFQMFNQLEIAPMIGVLAAFAVAVPASTSSRWRPLARTARR